MGREGFPDPCVNVEDGDVAKNAWRCSKTTATSSLLPWSKMVNKALLKLLVTPGVSP